MGEYLPDSGHARTKLMTSLGLSPVVRLTLRANTKYHSACVISTRFGLGRTSDIARATKTHTACSGESIPISQPRAPNAASAVQNVQKGFLRH